MLKSDYEDKLLSCSSLILAHLVSSSESSKHSPSRTELCDDAIDYAETLLKRLGYGKREDKRD